MTAERMIELLQIEKECVERNAGGCNRRCAECDLAQKDSELIDLYDSAILFIRKHRKPYESKAKLPCTCGRKSLITWSGWDGNTPYWEIKCPICENSASGDSEIAAIRAWNKLNAPEK